MADIAKCTGKDCVLKSLCRRYMAESNEHWQSWSEFKPDENGECDGYYPEACSYCHQVGYHKLTCDSPTRGDRPIKLSIKLT